MAAFLACAERWGRGLFLACVEDEAPPTEIVWVPCNMTELATSVQETAPADPSLSSLSGHGGWGARCSLAPRSHEGGPGAATSGSASRAQKLLCLNLVLGRRVGEQIPAVNNSPFAVVPLLAGGNIQCQVADGDNALASSKALVQCIQKVSTHNIKRRDLDAYPRICDAGAPSNLRPA
jgi:hypothetical protein